MNCRSTWNKKTFPTGIELGGFLLEITFVTTWHTIWKKLRNSSAFSVKRGDMRLTKDVSYLKTLIGQGVSHLQGNRAKTSIVPGSVGHRTTRYNADGGTRTHGLLLRRQALYPLSYVSMGTV